jgi:transposase
MDVDSVVGTVFSGLSALVVQDVMESGGMVVVTARTREAAVPCPVCGTATAKVHGYHHRTVKDVPVDGRQVVVHLRVRRLVCPIGSCRRQTFREQVPGLLERHQHRTVRLVRQISQVAQELCGRAPARLAGLLAVPVSRSTALRRLRRLPLPELTVPRVIGVDDFALRRRHRYATIVIDAETGRRVAVLPGRDAATLESWLRDHPGVEVVCRDGSATYAETVRRALPDAVQVSDRRHLWRNLCDKPCSKSARTPHVGPPSTRPAQAEFTSRPSATAGTRSTICSAGASVCSTAHGAST